MIQTLDNLNRNKVISLKQIYSDPLIKLKKYNEAYTMIGPGLDQNGNPVTGLTEDVKGLPVKGAGIPPIIPGTRKILEKELDLPEGTLKSTSPFWVTYNVRIGAEPINMDLSDPHDLLKYLFLIAQSIVANGLKEIGKDSRVEYVLFSEEQEAESRVNERKILKQAYTLSEKLDLETKVNILAVYSIIVDATNVNTIEDKIDEKIEEDPAKFLAMVKDDYLVFKSLVTKCLDKGVLIMEDGAILHGEVRVGYSKDVAAEAIAKDETLQAVLKAKLSGDMDLISVALKKQSKELKD
jgi:hypothetical protein